MCVYSRHWLVPCVTHSLVVYFSSHPISHPAGVSWTTVPLVSLSICACVWASCLPRNFTHSLTRCSLSFTVNYEQLLLGPTRPASFVLHVFCLNKIVRDFLTRRYFFPSFSSPPAEIVCPSTSTSGLTACSTWKLNVLLFCGRATSSPRVNMSARQFKLSI